MFDYRDKSFNFLCYLFAKYIQKIWLMWFWKIKHLQRSKNKLTQIVLLFQCRRGIDNMWLFEGAGGSSLKAALVNDLLICCNSEIYISATSPGWLYPFDPMGSTMCDI